MELYLRWLEENEQESSEESPLGLILCAEGGHESISLLRLDQAGIRVGQYLTELPPKEILESKLHESITLSRALLDLIIGVYPGVPTRSVCTPPGFVFLQPGHLPHHEFVEQRDSEGRLTMALTPHHAFVD